MLTLHFKSKHEKMFKYRVWLVFVIISEKEMAEPKGQFENRKTTEEILKKYGAKIDKEIQGYEPKYSQNYRDFKQSMTPSFSRYEKWCKAFGNFLTLKLSEKDTQKIGRAIEIAHLNLAPSEAVVFAVSILGMVLFGGALFMTAVFLLTGFYSVMLIFFFLIFSIFLFYFTLNTPQRLAVQWRLKASSQMVPAILYIVIYMKHTSNFERAISFAAEHLQAPLSLDFRKIFWDVEVGRFSSVKESVDHYLEGWRDYSLEFIEAFHLIESSLYEVSEERRVQILEKSLQVILDGVYDKMLKYTHDVKSPLTNIYMLGIVLPTLALAILPLASSLLQGAIKWWHVMLIFDILVPFLVVYMTGNIMNTRPGGYGETSLLEMNPLYPKYKSNRPFIIAGLIALPLFLIGLLPVLWTYTPLHTWVGMEADYSWKQLGISFMGDSGVFGVMTTDSGNTVGPFGVLSLILSLFIPLSIAMMFYIAFNMRTRELRKSRNQYKEVEHEFTSSLFQLGNRIGDGLPAEIAFSKVAESSKGTATEGFFRIVNQNIQQLGMSSEQALFNPKRGAVVFYPSELIGMSMKILVESVKKGLKVAARSLMSISEYVKNIRKIDERLDDLLADITSDMKSNMTFLAPLLGGIIVGLAGMITTILSTLETWMSSGMLGDSASALDGAGGLGNILGIFNVTTMIPTYFLQVVVGIYLIEIVFILTSTLVTVKSGQDTLEETAETGENLRTTILLYFVVALLSIIGLSLIGAVALSGLA
jgi:Flp pilus assembly protein TadB